MNEGLTNQLLALPADIHATELTLVEETFKQTETVRLMEGIEAHIRSDVAMNKSLKNAEERKASMELQLREHAAYNEFEKKVRANDLVLKKTQIELSYLKNTMSCLIAIAGMR